MSAITKNRANKIADIPKALALALDRAYNTSSRSGVAWVITKNGMIVESQGSMSGYPQGALFKALRGHNGKKHLYLSTQPSPPFISTEELIDVCANSDIEGVHFPKTSDVSAEELNSDLVDLYSYELDEPSRMIDCGPNTLKRKMRPWVTCLTGADITGRSVPLNFFHQEFGVRSSIERIIKQSHALIVQKEYEGESYLIQQNVAGGEMSRYEVDTLEELNEALKEQYLLGHSSIVLIANNELMYSFSKEGLIDEIIYHFDINLSASGSNLHLLKSRIHTVGKSRNVFILPTVVVSI